MQNQPTLAPLSGHRYVSLTTFRKTGKPVATPVWFAGNDREIFVWTNSGSGKVKRLRNNRAVKLAPCTYNGRVTAPEIDGRAEILAPVSAGGELAEKKLRAKYGWQWVLGRFLSRTFRRQSIFLKIVP